ncbi:MAG: pantoate--beta-alanine ligase, partial [Myxococcales bacterium]|nr:pantoate--beta-alanine ligase [Myxococcales bacterium]
VNPTQFNDRNDLLRYPRTLDADLAACEKEGIDIVFAPDAPDMYTEGDATYVQVTGPLTESLEGAFRPGHFRGVTTVVAKLLSLAAPCHAAFGLKDYQQFRVITRMVQDLRLRAQLVAVPTVREPDGLALSSRNARLSPVDRQRASALFSALKAGERAAAHGRRDPQDLEALVRETLSPHVDGIDYVRLANPRTLEPAPGGWTEATLLIAAEVGGVRLIDNLTLR